MEAYLHGPDGERLDTGTTGAVGADRIRQCQPWEKSAGPKTEAGKAAVSRNAYKGGTWWLLRELSRALCEQNRRLVE